MATTENNWVVKLPGLTNDLIRFSPQRQQRRSAELSALEGCKQQLINDGWRDHECCHQEDGNCDQRTLTLLLGPSRRSVVLWSIYGRGSITVPAYACSKCNTSFSPSAVQADCFPATPVMAEAWYDLQLLDIFTHVGVEQGLSLTGTQTEIQEFFWLMHGHTSAVP